MTDQLATQERCDVPFEVEGSTARCMKPKGHAGAHMTMSVSLTQECRCPEGFEHHALNCPVHPGEPRVIPSLRRPTHSTLTGKIAPTTQEAEKAFTVDEFSF